MLLTEEQARDKWPVTGRKLAHSKGYLRLRCPSHPNATKEGYVYEHTYVASMVLGRGLRGKETVHHINGNPADSGKSNLLICDHKYHRQLHVRLGESQSWPQFRPHKSSRPRCSVCHKKIHYETRTGLCLRHFWEVERAKAEHRICRVIGCGVRAGARSGLCLPHLNFRSNKRRYAPRWEFPEC